MLPDDFREKMPEVLSEIRDGTFAAEWEAEQMAGYPEFRRLRESGLAHPINEAEDRLRKLLQKD